MLQIPSAKGRLVGYLAVGGSKRPPLARSAANSVFLFAPQFGRSCGCVQNDIGRMKEESHPRVGPALILLEGRWQSSVGETCLGFLKLSQTGCGYQQNVSGPSPQATLSAPTKSVRKAPALRTTASETGARMRKIRRASKSLL
jgi:hypothetical protein